MTVDPEPGYYAIIPANVRYDDSLTANAKLLYGEISALTKKHGFCFASNAYFAQLYNVSERRIQIWIAQLKKSGCISVDVDYKEGSKRKIYLNVTGVTKRAPRDDEKGTPGGDEKGTHNNTRYNTTPKVPEDVLFQIWQNYPAPRRCAKRPAFKAIMNAIKRCDIEPSQLLSAVKQYAASWVGTESQFIPMLTTWMNQDRFEIPAPKPKWRDVTGLDPSNLP